jgi:hypothetical protein
MKRFVWIAATLVASASAARAQISVDSLWAEAASRHLWRGMYLGDAALAAGARFNLHGVGDRHAWQWSQDFVGRSSLSSRPPGDGDRRLLTETRLTYLGPEKHRQSLWFLGDGQYLPSTSGDSWETEIGAGFASEAPWLPERWPLLSVQAVRGFGRNASWFASADLGFDYKLKPWLLPEWHLTQTWSSAAPAGRSGARSFAAQATELTLGSVLEVRRGTNSSTDVYPYFNLIWGARDFSGAKATVGIRVTQVY